MAVGRRGGCHFRVLDSVRDDATLRWPRGRRQPLRTTGILQAACGGAKMGPACWFRSSERLTPMIEPGRVSRLGTSEGELVEVPFGRGGRSRRRRVPGASPPVAHSWIHARPISCGRLDPDIGDLIGDLVSRPPQLSEIIGVPGDSNPCYRRERAVSALELRPGRSDQSAHSHAHTAPKADYTRRQHSHHHLRAASHQRH